MSAFRLRWVIVLVALGLGSAAPASAGGMAPDLQAAVNANPASTTPVRVIVQYRPGSAGGLLFGLLSGIQLLRHLPLVNGDLLSVPLNEVSTLAAESAVKWVSPDRALYRYAESGVPTIGADAVWTSTGQQGSGIRVAVLDTGIYAPHPDLGSRLVAWYDCVNGSATPYDDDGHGTHVAGCVLGSGAASGGAYTGTAPAADLVAVKVLGQGGSGTDSAVIAGLDWCVQNAPQLNIRIVNLSLGRKPTESTTTDPLCAAVRKVVAAGITVICSAGNKGMNGQGATVYGGIGCPGNEPAVITVGASNTQATADRGDDTVCHFSSRGPTAIDQWAKPDLVAPGNQVVSLRAPGSALDTSYPQNQVGTSYFTLSGTSFAAPRVAGVVALMLSLNPYLDPNTIKGALQYTAEPLNTGLTPGLDCLTQGAGLVNAPGAVSVAQSIQSASSVGSPWLRSPLAGSSQIGSRLCVWSGEIFWGSQRFTGGDLFNDRQSAWSGHVWWNDATTWYGAASAQDNGVSADQSVWSSQAVWTDPTIWPDQSTWGESVTMTSGEAFSTATTD